MKVIFLSFFILFSIVYADYKQLRCLVCRAAVEEMTKQIDTVNPKKKIQVGGYRLDNTGKVEEKLVDLLKYTIVATNLRNLFFARGTTEQTSYLVENLFVDDIDFLVNLGFYKLKVPYARSSMHLSELMETICEKFQDYVRATDKITGKLLLLKLLTDDGSMNPLMSSVDIIQDSDLNKSLGFYCEGIVEEFEDEIYNVLKKPSLDPVNNVCTEATQLCDSTDKDEL